MLSSKSMYFLFVPLLLLNLSEAKAAKPASAPPQLVIGQPAAGEFIVVPKGCFQMGDTFGEGQSDETPLHEVCVDSFLIGKYEVTQGQWQAVMGKNPSLHKGDTYPVDNVSWNDAQEFISKLNQQTGKQYRLPTEAEWEYAARSGGKAEKYAGGDNVQALSWNSQNSGGVTHPVGEKGANGLGIYDMSGNVWEWCQDWRNDGYYKSSPRQNPTGPPSGSTRVNRGGSWNLDPSYVRAANRSWGEPNNRSYFLGFRLASSQIK
ncbi:MAG: formylglycine-generating enzyme family protein [Desulfobulbaceae bacterium]|nr:formylglycine-generating enzyme family protein [Desulfobulbaceae bacterium]